VRKKIVIVVSVAAVLLAGMALLGSLRATRIITVSRTTVAPSETVWALWADVPNRTRWDRGLDWARIDGEFARGAGGEVKVAGQPPRRFTIMEAEPPYRYTDRFYLPLGTKMDWRHSVEELGTNQRQVTFRIEVSGPTSFMLAPILKLILRDEIPATVDTLVEVAEEQSDSPPTR
jgi:Polyketide cyclase / dehydrase and lipid transport